MGRIDEAVTTLRAALRWRNAEEYTRHLRRVDELEMANSREGLRGRNATEMKQIPQTTNRPSYFLALRYAILGNHNKSFEYINRAYMAHDSELLALNVDPEWDRLRSDPRLAMLVKKIGLLQALP